MHSHRLRGNAPPSRLLSWTLLLFLGAATPAEGHTYGVPSYLLPADAPYPQQHGAAIGAGPEPDLQEGIFLLPPDIPQAESEAVVGTDTAVLKGALIAWPLLHAIVAALLLPAFLTLFPLDLQIFENRKRKRRSFQSGNDALQPLEVGEWSEVLESLARAAETGGECVERTLCQMKGVNKSFYRALGLHSVVQRLVPERYRKLLTAYQESAPEACRRYSCRPRRKKGSILQG